MKPLTREQITALEVQFDIPRVFVDPLFSSKPQFKKLHKVFRGGRTGGKSHNIARYIIYRCLCEEQFVLCCREIMKTLKDSNYKLFCDLIREMGLSDYFRIKESEIICISTGARITFAGMYQNLGNLKGWEGVTILWVEEANYVSKKSIDLIIPSVIRTSENVEFLWSYNPTNEDDPVHEYFAKPRDDVLIVEVQWYDNPHQNSKTLKEIARCWNDDPEEYNHIYGGQLWNRTADIVYKRWESSHELAEMCEAMIAELPVEECPPRVGIDFGHGVSEAAGVQCYLIPQAEDHKDILYIQQETGGHEIPVVELPGLYGGTHPKEKWKNPGGYEGLSALREGYTARADSARSDLIDDLVSHGLKVVPCEKYPGSVWDGIEFCAGNRIIIHPHCFGVLRNIRSYKYRRDSKTDRVLPDVIKLNDDYMDAMRYAVEDARHQKRKMKPIGYKRRKRKRNR